MCSSTQRYGARFIPKRVGHRLLVLLTVVLGVGLVASGTVATANPHMRVVAAGLHSPRGLTFGPGGILYIAQAGDATQASAIFQVRSSMSMHPKVRTLVDGLPTIGDEGEFIGVDGISILGRGSNFALYAIVGLAPQNSGSDAFGQLLRIDRRGSVHPIVNVGSSDFAWSTDHPDLWEEFVAGDANPYDVLALPDHTYVVDAGTNTLDEVMDDGTVQVLAFFPNEAIRDAVPTCVTQGPDGALYVGTLALEESFAFGPTAKVYRVDPSQADLSEPWNTPMTVWASGLWPINGCAFGPDGNLYATQLFTNPDLSDPQGDVVEIPWDDPSSHLSLTGGALSFTGDVAVAPNGDVFVSNGTAFVPPGTGTVVRIGG